MKTNEEFIVERIDDIPLLLGLMMKLQIPVILDVHLGNHGNQQGLSNGWVATIWLAFILSEGKHSKVHVQEWVGQRQHLLEQVSGQTWREEDFTDDRLSIILRRMRDPDSWHRIEMELWQSRVIVHERVLTGVRLDSTTSYGYPTVQEEGILQYGYSKDPRPDLPQVKLMVAAAEPTGELIACDVCSGEQADDALYVRLIERVGRVVQRRGLLYTGDSKMAALATRAHLVKQGDYYLTVLPRIGETAQAWDAWLDTLVDGPQDASLIWREKTWLGSGYEFSRTLSATVDDEGVTWSERVQLVRSTSLAQTETAALEKRLHQASDALPRLTPPPGRGRRQ